MSTEAVIQELRSMQGFGLITEQQCVRCERLIERYPDMVEEFDGTQTQILERIVEAA